MHLSYHSIVTGYPNAQEPPNGQQPEGLSDIHGFCGTRWVAVRAQGLTVCSESRSLWDALTEQPTRRSFPHQRDDLSIRHSTFRRPYGSGFPANSLRDNDFPAGYATKQKDRARAR